MSYRLKRANIKQKLLLNYIFDVNNIILTRVEVLGSGGDWFGVRDDGLGGGGDFFRAGRGGDGVGDGGDFLGVGGGDGL